MFDTDNEKIYAALKYWANYIETGDVCLSRNDAIRMNKRNIIKPLNIEQEKFVIKLRELAEKYYV